MAPAVGPTAALAMCAAAIVGWRVPKQQISEPQEPDATNDDMNDPNILALHSHNISDEFCESAFLELQQHTSLNFTSAQGFGHRSEDSPGDIAMDNVVEQGFGHPSEDSLGDIAMDNVVEQVFGHPSEDGLDDIAMDNVVEHGSKAIAFAHNSIAMLQNASMLINHDTGVVFDDNDNLISLVNSNSEKETIATDNESFSGLKDASRFDQSACPPLPSETVKALDRNNFTAFSADTKVSENTEEFPSVKDFARAKTEAVSEPPQHDCDVLEIHSDQRSMQPHWSKEVAPTNRKTEGQEPASAFASIPSELFELMLWSWQASCKECQRIFSHDMLDKASEVLHQQWQSWLATSRSVLGEDLLTRVFDHRWQVVLMCFASLCDMVLFGVFGRFVVRHIPSFCCRGRRKEPVQTELDVAVAKQNTDRCENLMSDSDKQNEIAQLNSGTEQVLAPMLDDAPRETACGERSVEIAMKGQRNPFNSAIQVHSIPTPSRRVIAGQRAYASSQNTVATSVSVERA